MTNSNSLTEENFLRIFPTTDFTEFTKFLDELDKETDRARVLIGASKLEENLKELIKKFLVPNSTSEDELFNEGRGLLSDFYSKIIFSYRLGLIDSDLYRDLNLIRRLRNSFAHDIYGANFASVPHKDRLRALLEPYKETFKKLKEPFPGEEFGPEFEFNVLISTIVAVLSESCANLKPLKDDQTISLKDLRQ